MSAREPEDSSAPSAPSVPSASTSSSSAVPGPSGQQAAGGQDFGDAEQYQELNPIGEGKQRRLSICHNCVFHLPT